MWQAEASRPLTFAEEFYLADIAADLDVCLQTNFPKTPCPLVNDIGPYEAGDLIRLPFFISDELIKLKIALPVPPKWLTADGLENLVKAERKTVHLLPPPDPYYIEIALRLSRSAVNAWWQAADPWYMKRKVERLFDEYVNIRKRKLRLVDDKFLLEGYANSTMAANIERRVFSNEYASYIRRLNNPDMFPSSKILESIYTHFKLKHSHREHENWLLDRRQEHVKGAKVVDWETRRNRTQHTQ